MKRFLLTVAFCMAGLALAHGTAIGQSTFGMIEGRVTDATGGALPGASVTITNTRTGATRVVVTNVEGLYRAPNLSPSDYDVRVELVGFQAVVQQGVRLSVSKTLSLPFKLGLESMSETVTVTGERPLVRTADAEIGQTIESQRVEGLPINSRDFSRLALLSPGAKMVTSGVADMMFNGTDQQQNNFLLDGTDATMWRIHTCQTVASAGRGCRTASSESIEEFRDAELQLLGGVWSRRR